MKIAYIYDALYPFIKGGAEKRYYELGRRLSADHEVHFISWNFWNGPSEYCCNGITLHGVGSPRPLYTARGRRSIRESLDFALCLLKLRAVQRFDVIDCCAFPYLHMYTARLLFGIKREPLVMTWHEYWGEYWDEYLGSLAAPAKLVERAAVPLAQSCVAVSELTAARLKRLGRVKSPVAVIPNGVHTSEIADIPAEGPDSDIIYVGRLLAHKRLDLLLRALAELRRRHPKLHCLIIGGGPERDRLLTLAATLSLQDSVTFAGEVPEAKVYGSLKKSKVFVLPSTREGFGMSVLEAHACGVPTVVVRAPYSAAHEIVADGVNGIVAEPSPRSLAEAISSLLDDPTRRSVMAEAARQAALRYDWAVIAQKMLGIYQAVQRC
jgi:glycosyltransferase involved in cell wall biosynthesis